MNTLTELHCPECQSLEPKPFKQYNTIRVHNGERRQLKCDECGRRHQGCRSVWIGHISGLWIYITDRRSIIFFEWSTSLR